MNALNVLSDVGKAVLAVIEMSKEFNAQFKPILYKHNVHTDRKILRIHEIKYENHYEHVIKPMSEL